MFFDRRPSIPLPGPLVVPHLGLWAIRGIRFIALSGMGAGLIPSQKQAIGLSSQRIPWTNAPETDNDKPGFWIVTVPERGS